MFLTEDSVKDVIVAATQVAGERDGVASTIKETVDALIAADRRLREHEKEINRPTSEVQKQGSDIES